MTRKPYNEADVERILEEAARPDRPPMDDTTTADFLSLIRSEAAAYTRNRPYKRVVRGAAAAAVLGVCAALMYRLQPPPPLPVGQKTAVTAVCTGGGVPGEEETIYEKPVLLAGGAPPDAVPGMGGDGSPVSNRETAAEEPRLHHPERQEDTLPDRLRKIFSELLYLPGREG